MGWVVLRSPQGVANSSAGSNSARANKLYKLKQAAKKIREDHADGKISADEAARQISELYSMNSAGEKLSGPSLLSA